MWQLDKVAMVGPKPAGGMTQFSNWLAWLARQKMIAGVPCTWGRPRVCVLQRDRGGGA